jgi:hypothetical protein
MHPYDLDEVQERLEDFNSYIASWAERPGHDWPIMDMNQLFKDRTSPKAKNSPTMLNGLFTGTPRPVRREGDDFLRGMGNTMMGWDGVHPNSAGYSLAANKAIRALNLKLKVKDYGGLQMEAVIDRVPGGRMRELLINNYLQLERTRIYDYYIPDEFEVEQE